MKTPVLRVALFALVVSSASAGGIAPGASVDEVRAVLGKPAGQMRLGDRHMLYYAHGSVELTDGRVTRVDLRSAEEQTALAAKEERRQNELMARRGQLVKEGTALRDRKLADAAFLNAPVAYQVAFWEDFARRYPGVSCVEPLTIARLKFSEQIEERTRKEDESRRLRELEARVAAAEREPVYYRVASYPRYRDRHDRQQEFALWPVSYTYYDAPKPAYETPTTPLVNPFTRDPAQPERRELDRGRGWDDCRPGEGGLGERRDWNRSSRESRRGRL